MVSINIFLPSAIKPYLSINIKFSEFAQIENYKHSDYSNFIDKYYDYSLVSIRDVIVESPIIGYGFEVGPNQLGIPFGMRKEIRPQNIRVTSDMFFVQVFRQTGLIGLAFFLGLFIVMPLYFIFVKRFTNSNSW